MGYSRKEKNGTWTARWDEYVTINGVRKRKEHGKSGFRLQRYADQFWKDIEAEKRNGRYVPVNDVLFVQYKDDWLDKEYLKKWKSGAKKPKTYLYYKGIFAKRFDDYFSNDKLQDISLRRIENYLSFLSTVKGRHGKPLSKSTIRKHYESLRVLFNYAVKHRDVKFSPLTEIDPPKKPKSKVEFWDPEIIPDALKLFEGTKGEWYVKMALYTGLREGELCGLHEDFIDFKKEEFEIREQCQYIQGEGHIFLPPKTDESEEPLPLVSPIDELLRERILENKKIV